MPAKDHAAWDIGSATRRASQLREPSAEELRDLAQARIAFLADALAAPGAIREEYERRNPPGRPPSLRRLPLVLLGIAWIAMLIGVGIGGYKTINLTTAVLILSTLSALIAARNWRRWFGPRERQRARRCPDCGYDLSGSHAEAPLDAERLGVELGPRHCPECGAFWPLVPPADLGPSPNSEPLVHSA